METVVVVVVVHFILHTVSMEELGFVFARWFVAYRRVYSEAAAYMYSV